MAAVAAVGPRPGWSVFRDDVPGLHRPPSEIVRERCWFTTQPIDEPENLAHLATTLRHAGLTDRILFASDYPHWDFDDPVTALRVLPADVRRPIMGPQRGRALRRRPPGGHPVSAGGAVDADAHVAPASLADLAPYLPAYWRDYVEGAALRLDPTQAGAYPPGAVAAAAPADVATLRARVLDAPAPGGAPSTWRC